MSWRSLNLATHYPSFYKMKKLKKLPFFIALLSTISSVSLFSEESFIPKPPSLNASNYILMDSVSGRILAENDSDERIEPASITKIIIR